MTTDAQEEHKNECRALARSDIKKMDPWEKTALLTDLLADYFYRTTDDAQHVRDLGTWGEKQEEQTND